MLGNQTTVFKNDRHFGGDVVLETTVRNNSDYMDVQVIVIPYDLDPMGGAMVWELDDTRYVAETHEELLEVLKGEEYQLRGGSVVVDILEAQDVRETVERYLRFMGIDFPKEKVNELVETLKPYQYHDVDTLYSEMLCEVTTMVEKEDE